MHFPVTKGLVQQGSSAAHNSVFSYVFVCLFSWLVGLLVVCLLA